LCILNPLKLFSSKSPQIVHLKTSLIVHLKNPSNCLSHTTQVLMFYSNCSGTHFYSTYSVTYFLLKLLGTHFLLKLLGTHFLLKLLGTHFLLKLLRYSFSTQSKTLSIAHNVLVSSFLFRIYSYYTLSVVFYWVSTQFLTTDSSAGWSLWVCHVCPSVRVSVCPSDRQRGMKSCFKYINSPLKISALVLIQQKWWKL
jgi:hypothetical protein